MQPVPWEQQYVLDRRIQPTGCTGYMVIGKQPYRIFLTISEIEGKGLQLCTMKINDLCNQRLYNQRLYFTE